MVVIVVVDFVIPLNHRVKIKASNKNKQILGFFQGNQNAEEHKVTVIPFVVYMIGTVPTSQVKRLGELEIRGRFETIQTMALLKYAGIF